MSQLRLRLSAFKLDATSTVGAVFLAFGLGVVLGGYLMTVAASEQSLFTFIKETYSNFGIEMVSIALTVIVIDRLNRRRDEQREERELKAQLLRDVRSKVADVAVNAVHQMQERGWLKGKASLLRGAHLIGANLNGVQLTSANLNSAHLFGANLSGAHLSGANLSDADLRVANLHGSHLFGANLSGAFLSNGSFDETTTLPDGKKWTPGDDLSRFTNPAHPNFWRSDILGTPAYRGAGAAPTATTPPEP